MADVSEKHLHRFAHEAHKWREKFHGFREANAKAVERTVRTVTIAAGAFAAGTIDGRFDKGDGAPTIMHVPATLAIGVGLIAAGYAGAAGKDWSVHLHNFGDGFVANYAAAKGHKFGADWLHGGVRAAFGHAPSAPAQVAAAAHGMPDPAQMAQAVANMQAAAGVPR
jgi:hypothetical protein